MTTQLQNEIALLGELTSELKELDARLVAKCDTEQAAFRLCRSQSRVHYTDEALADLMGVSRGTLNQLLNSDQNKRVRHMGRALQNRLQQACGNRAIDQWGDLELKGMLDCQRTAQDEIATLKARLAVLEGAQA